MQPSWTSNTRQSAPSGGCHLVSGSPSTSKNHRGPENSLGRCSNVSVRSWAGQCRQDRALTYWRPIELDDYRRAVNEVLPVVNDAAIANRGRVQAMFLARRSNRFMPVPSPLVADISPGRKLAACQLIRRANAVSSKPLDSAGAHSPFGSGLVHSNLRVGDGASTFGSIN